MKKRLEETVKVSEPETVSVNAVTAMYGPRATAGDKSGGLEFEYQSDLPKVETEYSAGEGTILWTPKLEGGKVVSGTLTLRNAVIDADSTGIQVCVPTTVVLEGENRISAGKTNSAASGMTLGLAFEPDLNISDGSVITGSGSLEIQSQGDGVQSPKGITIDGARVSIVFGGTGGIWTSDADITIRDNSQVKVTGSASNGGIWTQVSSDILIENSKVIAVNNAGAAMRTGGNIRLISSDVRAVGKTDTSKASGTLSYGHLTVDGGLLYAGNTGTDEGIPNVSGITEMINGAVLYTPTPSIVLKIQGGAVWYSGSSYDQDKDKITVIGNGDVIGSVVWNENMCISKGKYLRLGRYYDAELRIPEETIMEIPESSFLYIYSSNGRNGKLINNGTINIQNGGSMYNMYTAQKGGIIENNGVIQVSDTGVLQNRSNLTNNGSIHSTGNFSNVLLTGYQGNIVNTGTIDGFVIEMQDTADINKANGNTVMKAGQTLTVGAAAASSGRNQILQVLEGATLTVEEGAVIDAKTYVTKDTLSQYLGITDTLVLNGTLLLPADTPQAAIQELGQHIEGNGRIQLGDRTGQPDYYIVQVAEGAAGNIGKGLYKEGTVVNIDAGSRDGYRFTGWTAVPGSVVLADASAARTTFTMPAESVALTANWEQITYGVTVNGSKASVTGAGVYAAGTEVSIDAGAWEGYVFQGWSSGDGVTFADPSQAATTFVMPGHSVTVTASWGEKPEETTPSPEETEPSSEETEPSSEETTPSPEETEPSSEETTPSLNGADSSSGNQPSSSGTHGKQEKPAAAKPEETLPTAETEAIRNQGVPAMTASADTGDVSDTGWYLLFGILSLSGFMVMIRHLEKNTFG